MPFLILNLYSYNEVYTTLVKTSISQGFYHLPEFYCIEGFLEIEQKPFMHLYEGCSFLDVLPYCVKMFYHTVMASKPSLLFWLVSFRSNLYVIILMYNSYICR